MIRFAPLWPAVAAAALLTGAGFAGGYALKKQLDAAEIARLKGDIARMEAAHAEDKRAAAEAAAARLAQSEAAARAVTLALDATKDRLAATRKRLKEELYALPTARGCGLSAGARGLLNAAIAEAGALPARAGASDRADAGLAADSGYDAGHDAGHVSEADLGGWIAEAAARYDECRARIDAIGQWDATVNGGQ